MSSCHVCLSNKLYKFLSLGPIPLANSFLTEDQLNEPEHYYPLDVCFCESCGLVQLVDIIPREALFIKYSYLTGTSQPMKDHFASLTEQVIKRFRPVRGSLVVDIGSNDGTLLRSFQRYDVNCLGIEPATNIAALAKSHGVDTLVDFFGERLAQKVHVERGSASVILATNVFAHVADLDDFLNGVTHLLAQDGVFIIEIPYLVDMLRKLEFDTIYHEHLRYFAVRPLVMLFPKFGMGVTDIERIGVHGGSLRIYVNKSTTSSSPSVVELLELERELKIDSVEAYQKFATCVSDVKVELVTLLRKFKAQGARIAGYGAPAKGNTLLNYCKIGPDILDYISDTTPFKQGCYTPGMHIPVVPESHFHEDPPNYALLLAWNYADEILRKEEAYRQAGGKFVIPIPRPQLV